MCDTSWLCVPCLPSSSWVNKIRTGVDKLDGQDKLAFASLQESNTTRSTVSRRRCVVQRSENKFTNNAWTMNETDKTGAINERMAVGLHEISFGNHSCDPSVIGLLPTLQDGYTICGSVKFTMIRDLNQDEEITFAYLHKHDMQQPTPVRQQELRTRWNFLCQCNMCTSDI